MLLFEVFDLTAKRPGANISSNGIINRISNHCRNAEENKQVHRI